MRSIVRSAVSLGGLMVPAAAVMLLTATADAESASCKAFRQSMASYQRELKAAIRDEPEDLGKELDRYARAMGSGYTAQADRIEQKIRSGFIRLQAIGASARVATMHAGMIEYYRSAVAFLDAHSEGDVAARRAAELDTWIGLREFFVDLRGLLVRHECASRDVETIDRRYMSALNDRIQKLRAD